MLDTKNYEGNSDQVPAGCENSTHPVTRAGSLMATDGSLAVGPRAATGTCTGDKSCTAEGDQFKCPRPNSAVPEIGDQLGQVQP